MIKENCQLGCPCDNYECDLPDKMAVLALYNSGSNKNGFEKPSVLIQPNGKCSYCSLFGPKAFDSNLIKVGSLKTLNFKWVKIQRFIVLALQH